MSLLALYPPNDRQILSFSMPANGMSKMGEPLYCSLQMWNSDCSSSLIEHSRHTTLAAAFQWRWFPEWAASHQAWSYQEQSMLRNVLGCAEPFEMLARWTPIVRCLSAQHRLPPRICHRAVEGETPRDGETQQHNSDFWRVSGHPSEKHVPPSSFCQGSIFLTAFTLNGFLHSSRSFNFHPFVSLPTVAIY